ncbi:MAG: amidase family protein, partial [Herbaspirillum sp.]
MKPPITDTIASLLNTSRLNLIDACLEAVQNSQSVFTRLYPDSARSAATHADAMRSAGVNLSPLAGLPVSIKDLLDVAGETTLAGSTVLQGAAAATTDAPVVARLRAAGAAIIGKTNMTEFAYSG